MSPNDLGKKFLVEGCQRVSISEFIGKCRGELMDTLINSEIEISGIQVELLTSKTGFGGVRYWFKCPLCGQRVGVLFKHAVLSQIGCRLCLNLEYRQRRYRGMLEGKSMV